MLLFWPEMDSDSRFANLQGTEEVSHVCATHQQGVSSILSFKDTAKISMRVKLL